MRAINNRPTAKKKCNNIKKKFTPSPICDIMQSSEDFSLVAFLRGESRAIRSNLGGAKGKKNWGKIRSGPGECDNTGA